MANKSKKLGWHGQLLLVIFFVTAVVFLPTTILLFIGMLPTIGARLVDRSKAQTKVFTVGFLNLAGCFPYWFKLVEQGHKFENAMQILSNPSTIVVMYAAAGIGYMTEWAVTNTVAGFMVQRGKKRLEEIRKFQEGMVVRWGLEVTGDLPLDPAGFPIESKE